MAFLVDSAMSTAPGCAAAVTRLATLTGLPNQSPALVTAQPVAIPNRRRGRAQRQRFYRLGDLDLGGAGLQYRLQCRFTHYCGRMTEAFLHHAQDAQDGDHVVGSNTQVDPDRVVNVLSENPPCGPETTSLRP